MRCAVIDTNSFIKGMVVNIIMAEPTDLAPEGCLLVGIEDGVFCDIGWFWDGSSFVDLNQQHQPDATDG